MQQLTVWNPIREMDHLLSRLRHSFAGEESTKDAFWVPLVDVSETPKEYQIKADVPGIKREDVKITINHGVLTVAGERQAEKVTDDAAQHRVERSYGTFSRSFTLPEDVLAEKITADCKNGVVSIILPKSERASSKALEVQVQ